MTESPLRALYLNCTLKRSPRLSHTNGLISRSRAVLEEQGVVCDEVRPVDLRIAFGMQADMVGDGWDHDDWPNLFPKVMDADILILGSPIWIGCQSSVATQVMERLYAQSSETNDKGQYIYYGKVAGVLVTGNEDGGKHVARELLYGLQHIGFTVPPQADAYWVGEAGPGPSYLDPDSGGPENEFTTRNVRTMSWNLLHFARMLRERGGIPAEGNT